MGWLKKGGIGLGALLAVVVLGGGAFAWTNAAAFDASIEKKYDVPPSPIARSADPAVLARGKHLAEAVLGCHGCHGADLAGGKEEKMGPLGTITGPNVTPAGMLAAYDDAELARLLSHGLRKDGTSVRFMPVQDISWLPPADLLAVVSYLRTVPPVERPNGPVQFGLLAKVLDRKELLVVDVARHIDHANVGKGPEPSATASYGLYLAKLCTGCHGPTLSGGPIPGAPSSLPVPSNLTTDATGLAGWTYDDFDRLLVQGLRKNGKKLDPFMPITSFGKMDDLEKHALFAYLTSLPALKFGGR